MNFEKPSIFSISVFLFSVFSISIFINIYFIDVLSIESKNFFWINGSSMEIPRTEVSCCIVR